MSDSEVRSGGRLIRIVELLGVERRPLTAAEIASRLSIPASSVHRLLGTLVSLGWAERRSGRLYQHGPGLLGAASLALGRASLVQLAKPVLGHVAELSGLDSYLGVLVANGVTYLARATARGAEAPEFKLGSYQPMHCTSTGKLLLALMADAERERLLETLTLTPSTDRTITDRDDLRLELDRIRANGYSTDSGEYSEFWRSVAVPVRGPEGNAVAAITCGGRPDRMTVEHQGWMRQEMVVLAEELSAQLA